MTLRRMIILPLLLVVLLGCKDLPQEILAWSPDARHFLLWRDGKFQLHSADGKAIGHMIDSTAMPQWLPDSRRICFASPADEKSWSRIAPLITADQREKTAALARDILKKFSDTQDFAAAFNMQNNRTDNALAMLYLRAHHWETIQPELQKLEQKSIDCSLLETAPVAQDGTIGKPTPLAATLDIRTIRISPDGQHAALVVADQWAKKNVLYVATLAGFDPLLLLAEDVALYPGWTGDSRSIVYAAFRQDDNDATPTIGSINRRPACDDWGNLIEKPEKPQMLALSMTTEHTRIHCLDDGRIIFSGHEINLPTTPNDLPQHGQLFALDPARSSTVTRLIPRQAAKDIDIFADFFAVSPDGKQVAIIAADLINLVSLTTGEATTFKSGALHNSYGSVPAWRDDGRLTCLLKGEDEKSVRLMLMEPGDIIPVDDPDSGDLLLSLPVSKAGEQN